jgi:glycosyltransferase involved in cell wall biosynthesis
MSEPYFSVIINNYNYARFLPAAINSVLRQSFTDYELIVVDDCSTDHSRDVILSYGGKVKPVFLETNGGQAAAFNAGVKASRGKLISFLDSDDVFYPDKLLRVYQTSLEKPDALLIYHQCYNMNVMGEVRPGLHPIRLWDGNLRDRIYRHAESITAQTSLLTFRREFIDKIFPVSQYLNPQAADATIQYLAGLLGEIACIKEPLTLYRMHERSIYSSMDFDDLDNIRGLMRRNEKEYYYINLVLTKLGVKKPFDIMKFRYYLGNICIFNQISRWKFLRGILFNPNFNSWKEKLGYINYILKKRQDYLRSKQCGQQHL